MKIEKVVEYRTHPKSIVTIDGEQYIPIKEFCAMTGLKPGFVVQSEEMQGQIVELPPTGKQRKPRKYVSVKAWLALWERVFKLWLAERLTDREQGSLLEWIDEEADMRKLWHWYGINRIAEMFELDPFLIADGLVDRDFITGSFHEDNLPPTAQGFWATDAAKATGWIHNHMPEPKPWGRWNSYIVLDVAHPGFAEFLADLKGWPIEAAKKDIALELQYEAEERDIKWRVKSRLLPVKTLDMQYQHRLTDRYERRERLEQELATIG